mgnify:CR=1 FL=1
MIVIYKMTFTGRTAGAIGIMQRFHIEFEARNLTDFRRQVYEKYDHIHLPQLTIDGEPGNFFAGVEHDPQDNA